MSSYLCDYFVLSYNRTDFFYLPSYMEPSGHSVEGGGGEEEEEEESKQTIHLNISRI
jgi:hypothetical protein